MSVTPPVQANHCKVEAIIRAHDLPITFCCSSHGQSGRAHCECVEKFTSCNHLFLLLPFCGRRPWPQVVRSDRLQKVLVAAYWPSFFSGSRGSGGSMGLRGSIWSRMAVLYTKLATITAICLRSSGCRRS